MDTPTSTPLLKTWNNLSDTMLRRLAAYKARLNVALQHPPNPRMIRRDLAQAQQAGFDPKTLWEQALRTNEDSKYPPPSWDDVKPSNSSLLLHLRAR
jgi:hypothetical protein